jgi:hypothetical protein
MSKKIEGKKRKKTAKMRREATHHAEQQAASRGCSGARSTHRDTAASERSDLQSLQGPFSRFETSK